MKICAILLEGGLRIFSYNVWLIRIFNSHIYFATYAYPSYISQAYEINQAMVHKSIHIILICVCSTIGLICVW